MGRCRSPGTRIQRFERWWPSCDAGSFQPDGHREFMVTPTVSIVVPTYNPQERAFARVLSAVGTLLVQPDVKVECVVVDNRSTPRLQDLMYVQAFLHEHDNARLVREEAQGLTFARL